MGKTIAVCSGRGGEGKTTVALSLAVGAIKHGLRAILLDASGTARTSDMILGIESVMALDMTDVAAGEASVHAALFPIGRYPGLQVACASLYDDAGISRLASTILILQSMCDVLVIDLPTGVTELGRGVLCERDAYVMILRPEEASVRASERLVARIRQDGPQVYYVLNHVSRELQRQKIQLEPAVVQMMLDCVASAQIPQDKSIPLGEAKGRPAVECDGQAWKFLSKLVDDLMSVN